MHEWWTNDGHCIVVVLNIEGTTLLLLNVYGYNGGSKNKILLDQISDVIIEFRLHDLNHYVLLGGDFNAVLNS